MHWNRIAYGVVNPRRKKAEDLIKKKMLREMRCLPSKVTLRREQRDLFHLALSVGEERDKEEG